MKNTFEGEKLQQEREPQPLKGEHREAWAKQLPDPKLEIYIDSATGEVQGSQKDLIQVRKDEETNEWVIVPAKNKVNDWGGTRIPVGKGEFSLLPKFNNSEVDSCPREWSAWKKEPAASGLYFSPYSHEKFAAGERGEKSFDDLQSAVDYILDKEDAYELRSGQGWQMGEKEHTGTRDLSNSFNFGMTIEGQNSGKKMSIGNCARVGTTKLTATLEAQQWHAEKTGKNYAVVGVLKTEAGNNNAISAQLEDTEVIIRFNREQP